MITIRDYDISDKNFIYSTFLKGVYYGSDWTSAIDKATFFHAYPAVLARLLSRDGVTIRVACLTEDLTTVLGYAVLENRTNVLHFIYVKQPWRGQGIATALVAGSEISIVTHITKPGDAIRKKKKLVFNPFLI